MRLSFLQEQRYLEQYVVKRQLLCSVFVNDLWLGFENAGISDCCVQQWSIIPFANTEAAVYFCGTFLMIRSIKYFFSRHFDLGVVGLSTIRKRFIALE